MMKAVERTSPLQLELARQIAERVRDEDWAPRTPLSPHGLAQALGVSRSPIRGALDLLVAHGVLEVTPGGVFVVGRRPDHDEIASLIPRSEGEAVYAAILRDRAGGLLSRDVSETELIPRYGVSRGVLRKVLMRFAAEGLARRQPGYGWHFVEALETGEAVAESARFRMVVECAALRLPGFHLDRERLQQLRRAHEDILAAGETGTEAWFRVDTAFHEALASASGNRFFLQAVQQQNALCRMRDYGGLLRLSQRRIGQSCREHLAILDALEAGDLDWAGVLLHRHLAAAAGLSPAAAAEGRCEAETVRST